MGTNCAQLLADLFLYSYENYYILSMVVKCCYGINQLSHVEISPYNSMLVSQSIPTGYLPPGKPGD